MASPPPTVDELALLNSSLKRLEAEEVSPSPSEILARLPDSYYASHDRTTVARHVELLTCLSVDEPYALDARVENDEIVLTVVTIDSPGLLSLLAGILGSSGLDIKNGAAFTMHAARPATEPQKRPPRRHPTLRRYQRGSVPVLPGRRIVDHFSGKLEPAVRLADFLASVSSLMDRVIPMLLPGSNAGEPRRVVDEAVAARLRNTDTGRSESLFPLEIDFVQDGSRQCMVVEGQDTPFFLYSLGAALSFQGISIESVEISTSGHVIRDTFELFHESGSVISTPRELDRVRFTVLLTKQFTHFLGNAPDPFAALVRFESLSKELTQKADNDLQEMIQDPLILNELARLLGTSDYLWEDFIRLQYENLLPLLRQHDEAVSTPPDQMEAALMERLRKVTATRERRAVLNEFKDAENFRIDLDHILRPSSDFFFLSHRLTALAEAIINGALFIAWEEMTQRYGTPRTVAGLPARYAVFGLGKLGGRALGYASDLELLFVYSDSGTTNGAESIQNAEFFERFFMTAVQTIETKREGIFAIDLRLRPYGSAGPHAVSLESFNRYYGRGGEAHSYEKLALTRLRLVAGDPEFGLQVERLRSELIYAADAIDLAAIRDLRARQLREKTKPQTPNAKFSAGGLVDLEYGLQILLVTHGRGNAALRTPSIHAGLEELGKSQVISEDEAHRLKRSYQFFRRLINGLRMLRGNAQDLFLPPVESLEYAHLARRAGYEQRGDLSAAEQLHMEFESRSAAVRAFVEQHLGRDSIPGTPRGNAADLVLSENPTEELVESVCRRAGLQIVPRALTNIRSLAGTGEQRELFSELIILAWADLSASVDPDMALNNWDRFVVTHPDPERHYRSLLSQPRMLELMLQVFAASQFLAGILISNPEFLSWSLHPQTVETERTEEEILTDLQTERVQDLDTTDREQALRNTRKREVLRIGTRDLCLHHDLATVTREISALARALLRIEVEALFQELAPEGGHSARFALLAFGKLGGNELNYSSDIDLLGLYEPDPDRSKEADGKLFSTVLTRLGGELSRKTPNGYVFRVDFRLRPHGSAGPLVSPFEAAVQYYRNKAELWEHQALLKLSPVAGNIELGGRFLKEVRPSSLAAFAHGDPRQTIQTLRHQAEKQVAEEDDVKNGAGGIRDIEFFVQGLQMVHGTDSPAVLTGNTMDALSRLEQHGILSGDTRAELEKDYVYLRRIEHLLQLFEDRQVHALPSASEERLAVAKRVDPGVKTTAEFEQRLSAVRVRVRKHYLSFTRSDE